MAKVLVVTSGKGGVGKTTSTAAMGAALAQAGKKVVVIDFDVGLRNLDLVMGAERRVVAGQHDLDFLAVFEIVRDGFTLSVGDRHGLRRSTAGTRPIDERAPTHAQDQVVLVQACCGFWRGRLEKCHAPLPAPVASAIAATASRNVNSPSPCTPKS